MSPPHLHSHAPGRFAVLATEERLDVDPTRRGRGVTVAFLDSGFTAHPDLTQPAGRVVEYVDLASPGARLPDAADPWCSHGTQTSVVAAGCGTLSDGRYRGLASEASLVLVKVSDRGRVGDGQIVRGLEWLVANHARLGIRVANLSLGGDVDVPADASDIDRLAEEAVRQGVTVVVAAGNAGCSEQPRPIPPASAASVITVGGYDDHDRPGEEPETAYCSNYGLTLDGLLKPEIVAPAAWVAAPVPMGTPEFARAEVLAELEATPDHRLCAAARRLAGRAGLPDAAANASPEDVRRWIEDRLRESRLVAPHYQHADGTSFAAPIVTSVVAQMLQVNPALTPAAVKALLIASAERLPDVPAARQGYGRVHPRRAVELALADPHRAALHHLRAPHVESGRLVFRLHDDGASAVDLAGDFNGWRPAPLTRGGDGLWRAAIETPPPGAYRYKFLIDGSRWTDDPANGLKEPDPYGGFNAIVRIAARA